MTGILILGLLALQAQPAVHLHVQPERIRQGEAALVRVRATGAASAALTVREHRVPLYRDGSGWVTLVGTDADTPDRIWITLAFRTTDGRVLRETASLRVTPVRFGLRHLRLDPRTRALLSPDRVALERRLVQQAEATSAPVRYWRGTFARPVSAPLTSGYGVRSVYNGVPGGFHAGVDFAAPTGTPVRAPQPGRVLLARPLPVSGLFVMLDHGQGLVTTYHHLSAIFVTEGSWVGRSQPIGAVGSTGLSTGPHLHWGMRLHGVRINPLSWTVRPRLDRAGVTMVKVMSDPSGGRDDRPGRLARAGRGVRPLYVLRVAARTRSRALERPVGRVAGHPLRRRGESVP